ncbi:MAG TPA: hypothetical protein PK388_02570 [Kiritimatiellia bacterium]|nr:hypothetical protein [Kiritimatiellia bacterium]
MKIWQSAVIGGAGGICIVLAMMSQACNSWIDSTWFETIHAPARYFSDIWLALDLPPHGDGGFIMIPVSVILQWTCIGYLVGLVFQTGKRYFGKK